MPVLCCFDTTSTYRIIEDLHSDHVLGLAGGKRLGKPAAQQVQVVAHHDRQKGLFEAGLKQQLQQQGGHLQVQQQCL